VAKSFYILELSIQPFDEGRRADMLVYNRPEHLLDLLKQEFQTEALERRSRASALCIGYGATLVIWVVQQGKVTKAIDLHPFIHVSLGGRPTLPLTEGEELMKMMSQADVEEEYDFSEVDPRFEIDWPAISKQLEPLKGEVLERGQRSGITVSSKLVEELGSYLRMIKPLRGAAEDEHEGGALLDYGYNALEGRSYRVHFREPDATKKKAKTNSKKAPSKSQAKRKPSSKTKRTRVRA
jgi:hypothetical protein